MNTPRFWCLLLSFLMAWFAVGQVDQTWVVREQTPPQGPKAGQPSWFQMASQPHLSWIESTEKGGMLRFARYQAAGWSAPKTVVQHDRMLVNWADVQKLAASGDLMVAVWPCRMEEDGHGYGLKFRRSLDQGQTWSEDQWLHEGRVATEYGFVSLVPLQGARIGVLWLDGRHLKPGDHHHGGGGRMQLRYLELSKHELGQERVLDERTCECCQTDMVAGPTGLIATFRDQSEEQIRDIGVVFERDGRWSKSRILFPDEWLIHGCPVNGPALAVRNQTLAGAWFTGQPSAKVQVGLWDLQADKPKARRALPGIPMGRVDTLFLDEHRLAVTWLEAEGETTKVMLALLANQKQLTLLQPPAKVATSLPGRAAGFPRITLHKGDVLMVYRVESGINVTRISL